MKGRLKDIGMIAGMVIAWTIYYAVSKYMVDATNSPYAAGFLLRMAALVFLTVQLAVTGGFKDLFRQGRATVTCSQTSATPRAARSAAERRF